VSSSRINFINAGFVLLFTVIGENIMEDDFEEKPRFGERRRGGSFDRGPREMHKVTCSECGQETEVPFKPIEGRPVYCRDCYQKHKPQRRERF
jgi:CxxC-x17-CxxC domain-containing protein